MALQPSGLMSIGGPTSGRSINLELSKSATATSGLGDADLRALADVPSGAISMSDFYGASSTLATGGNVDNLRPGNGYAYHTFTTTGSSGTFTVLDTLTAEILVVAGGGAGGGCDGGGGGGGAGGVAYCTSLSLSAGTYPVTVGAGQLGIFPKNAGGTGSNSVFNAPAPTTGGKITALGGGKGATGPRGAGANGTSGGSGGGGQGFQTTGSGAGGTQPGVSNPPNTTNYGNTGANGFLIPSGFGGGGGGAGAVGNPDGMSGGNGQQFPSFLQPLAFNPPHPYTSDPEWETDGYYGGGGSSAGISYGAVHVKGGGGTGNYPSVNGTPGVNGLGGGGGHQPQGSSVAPSGGHGVIIIRYAV